MAYTVVAVNNEKPLSLASGATANAARGTALLRRALNGLMAFLAGNGKRGSFSVFNSESAYLHRAGCAVLPVTSGNLGVIINGTTVTTAFDTDAATTASNAVADINADATVKLLVKASKYVGKMTLASATTGNSVVVCGVRFTGRASATGKLGDFDASGNDTADGLALANAINTHPLLADKLSAVNTAGVVYVWLHDNRAARADETLLSEATTITVNSQIGTATAIIGITALGPGVMGNTCSATVTGTGAAIYSLVTDKLGGGLGFGVAADVIEGSAK